MVGEFRGAMVNCFEKADLGLMSYILGIEVVQKNDGTFISQKYASDSFEKIQNGEFKACLHS